MKRKYEITIGYAQDKHTILDCEIHEVEAETIGEALGRAMRIPIRPFTTLDGESFKREIVRIQAA